MIEVPSKANTSDIADWAELSCLFEDKESISRSKILQAIEDANYKNPEEMVSNIWLEISRRHMLIEDSYPINTLTGRLARVMNWKDVPAYVFQLLISTHSFYTNTKIKKAEWNKVAKLFEKLSTLAIKRYLKGKAINIGFPRGNGIPKGFKQCLDLVCKTLKENRGPEKSYNLPTIKDHGVDIVAWQPFPDLRSSQLFILAQCAAGHNWKDKINDINLKIWSRFIDWKAQPLIAFAFPFICLDESEWRYLSDLSLNSILLDRLRIASMFISSDSTDMLLQKLIQWCESHIIYLPKLDN